jgi:hypothetical protein
LVLQHRELTLLFTGFETAWAEVLTAKFNLTDGAKKTSAAITRNNSFVVGVVKAARLPGEEDALSRCG